MTIRLRESWKVVSSSERQAVGDDPSEGVLEGG